MDFGSFEGIIQDGLFGAGQISVWDSGDYEVLGPGVPQDLLEAGTLEIRLKGRRLEGAFQLIRPAHAKWKAERRPNEWLLVRLFSPNV